MSTELPEGVMPAISEAGSSQPIDAEPPVIVGAGALAMKSEAEGPRTERMAPRPAGSSPVASPSHGGAQPEFAAALHEARSGAPSPPPSGPDDAATTERRPATRADAGRPTEIRRVLSPPPARPTAELAPAVTSEPAVRRRSRRIVNVSDDTKPTLDGHPPSQPPSAARIAGASGPSVTSFATPDDALPPTLDAGSSASTDAYDVIQPMRIINIGTVPPPVSDAAAAPAPDPAWGVAARHPSRPPLLASPALEAFVPPLPKPPAVEEVDAIAEDEPEAPITAAPPAVRSDEIESIPDDELVPERISDVPTDITAAVQEDIPIDVMVEAPAPKRPPPPPPKRAPASGEPPPLAATLPSLPTASPTPPASRAVEALAALPSPAAAPAAPPSSSAGAVVAATSAASSASAQTVDISAGRKRQKPWWEEIFSDDYLRTMERIEPKAIRKECDFIEDRLGLEKGAIMLDLACGPGAHAVELASRGYNVVGYDLSLAMLARAQDEAQERGQKINFLQGDMREMAFEEAFDGIYSWSTSFGYFDDEKNVNVLSRMHRGLRQGGMLLLDVANRDYICPRQPSLVWFEGDGCVCMDEMYVDFFASRLRVKRTVMFDDGRARECDYNIRIYGLHELGKMLHDTGFKVVEVTGHPSHPGVFFGSESPRIIVLAERA